ncbi:hypothetical protein DIPPA_04716 [Diplonema papillatum]|nr:hypothetical protein DIPPA_04716 [Diplonema papillatum]
MVDANFINTSVVEGGGAPWWTLRRGNSSAFAPNLLTIESSQNVTVSGLTLQNSPMYHLVAEIRVHSVTGVNLTIEAPADSPNTHTVDLAGEHHLLEKCYLAGGDDNVAIHPNASSIVVRNVHCSHGHGTSIGSVGLDNSTGFVTDVLFSDITYTGTSNIARVKTWQGGLGAVRNVTYRNLQFSDTGYPITIDQFYCPSGISSSPCFNSTRAVQLSDLTFENFHGTQNSGHAGEIHCADSSPCDNLVLRNITILPSGSKQGEWSCWQVVNSTDASTQPPLATAGNCHWN